MSRSLARPSRSTPRPGGKSGDPIAPRKVRNPGRDQPVQSRRRRTRSPAVRRHARCRAGRARCQNRGAALGNASRRLDAGLQHHQRPARREGQGDRRRVRRRVRRARIPRRLRRGDRQASVAMVHGARARRVWPRHVGGRQLEAGRRADLAHRLVRSGVEPGLLDHRQPRAADRSIGSRRPATTCSAIRWSRSIPTPDSADGTISSRPTTATTGIRVRT